MSKPYKIIFLLFLIFIIFPPKPAFAVDFTFSGAPANINETDTFSVNLNLKVSNSSGSAYYIKGGFSSTSTPTSYFGYTKNNQSNWYNGTDKTQYYKIVMDQSGQWSGPIEVKLDTDADPEYKGGGTYNFKLARYTAGGSTATYCDKESVPCTVASISVIAPTPQPTPTPTEKPAPTPTKTPTAIPYKSPTPTPTKSPTASLSSAITKSPTKTATKSAISISPKSALGISTKSADKKPTPDKKALVNSASQSNLSFFIITGISLLFLAGAITVYLKIDKKNE